MADITTGEWGTLTIEVPKVVWSLLDVQTSLNNIMKYANMALEAALAALNLAKTFIASFLNPIAALIEAVIAELRKIIDDLKNIGIYITGDWNLFKPPYLEIRSGFSGYEQRMIGRLTDITDPTRPDVSDATTVFGLFAYTSVSSPVDFNKILSILDTFRRFIGIYLTPNSGYLPVPILRTPKYGQSSTDVLAFGSLSNLLRLSPTPPDTVLISWTLALPAGTNPTKLYLQPPPSGFFVTVSTLPGGLPIYFDRPVKATDKKPAKDGKTIQPREYSQVLDMNGDPLVLHGGADMVDFDEQTFGYANSLDSKGNVKDNRCRVYGMFDRATNGVIPLEELTRTTGATKVYRLQRTFLMNPVAAGLQWARGEYSIALKLKDMPVNVDVTFEDGVPKITERPATQFYVRVATAGTSDFFKTPPKKVFKYDFRSKTAVSQAGSLGLPFTASLSDMSISYQSISQFSSSQQVMLTGQATQKYLERIKIALLLLVLTRSDLPVLGSLSSVMLPSEQRAAAANKLLLKGIALEATGLEGNKHLIDLLYDETVPELEGSKTQQDPLAYRQDLYRRINKLAQRLYESTGPRLSMEDRVVKDTALLSTVTWTDILNSRSSGGDPGANALTTAGAGSMTLLQSITTGIDDSLFRDIGEALGLATEQVTKMGGNTDYGLASHPYGMGVGENVTKELFKVISNTTGKSLIVTNRQPHFMEVSTTPTTDTTFTYKSEVPAAEANAFMKALHPGLQMFYERYKQSDGSIKVPPVEDQYLREIKAVRQLVGSADLSPVFYTGRSNMSVVKSQDPSLQTKPPMSNVAYCRSMLAGYQSGVLMQQAAMVLQIAGAAKLKSPSDGQWKAIRLGDMFPPLEDFLNSLLNWVETAVISLKGAADAIISYIEYLESRIVDLQQLIKNINLLLNISFDLAFKIPQVSGLALASKGTVGLVADLQAASNKPKETNQTYGAGLAIVVPGMPTFFAQLLQVFSGKPDPNKSAMTEGAPDVFGIEGIPASELFPPGDPEPDVL